VSAAKKASITDVARRAKVSITTVSRVINKVPTVNKEISARVEEAILAYSEREKASVLRGTGHTARVQPGPPGDRRIALALHKPEQIGLFD